MSSANSSTSSLKLGRTSSDNDVLSAIDRKGYPEDKKKRQPWKEMGLKITNKDGTDGGQGSQMFSSAWKMVLVACSRLHDMGTGGLGGH